MFSLCLLSSLVLFLCFALLVCVFLEKGKKRSWNFYFKIIIRFRTSSCFSDFFEILQLRKVVALFLILFFYFISTFFVEKRFRLPEIYFYGVLRLLKVSWRQEIREKCFKRICSGTMKWITRAHTYFGLLDRHDKQVVKRMWIALSN